MTFMTRPRVPRPTGTEIGPPWSMAFMPRTIPSVGCIATQRTRPSPKCCCTSRMTSIGLGTLKPSLTTLHGLIDRRKLPFGKLHVDRRPRNLNYVSYVFSHKLASSD